MSDTGPVDTGYVPAPETAGMSQESWFQRNKGLAIGGLVAVAAIGFFLLEKMKSSSSSSSQTPQVYEVVPGTLTSGQTTGSMGYNNGAGNLTGNNSTSSGSYWAGSVNDNAGQEA